jgi:hypothetical protein
VFNSLGNKWGNKPHGFQPISADLDLAKTAAAQETELLGLGSERPQGVVGERRTQRVPFGG